MPTKKEQVEFKLCPSCNKKNKVTAKKCKYCHELLSGKTKDIISETKKYKCNGCGQLIKIGEEKCSGCGKNLSWVDINIKKLPDERSELSERQKDVLINNYPLRGWYKIPVFLVPGLFLLYAKRFWLLLLLFLLPFILFIFPNLSSYIIGSIIARILICINWESICYSKYAINMKKTLLEYENKWNKKRRDYDDSEIVGHIAVGRLILTGLSVITLIMLVILLIFYSG